MIDPVRKFHFSFEVPDDALPNEIAAFRILLLEMAGVPMAPGDKIIGLWDDAGKECRIFRDARTATLLHVKSTKEPAS